MGENSLVLLRVLTLLREYSFYIGDLTVYLPIPIEGKLPCAKGRAVTYTALILNVTAVNPRKVAISQIARKFRTCKTSLFQRKGWRIPV